MRRVREAYDARASDLTPEGGHLGPPLRTGAARESGRPQPLGKKEEKKK